jgi:hypothetical protein
VQFGPASRLITVLDATRLDNRVTAVIWACDDARVRSVVARLGAGVAAVGLVTLVIGTFLPWLRSGSVLRDSYQARTVIHGLFVSHNAVFDAVFAAWPAVIPVCSVCVALYAVRLRRISSVACVIMGIAVAATATWFASMSNPNGLIGVESAGPVVTLAGSALAVVGAIAAIAGPTKQPNATPVGGWR